MTVTDAQLREGRRLLGWSADRLAAECNIQSGCIFVFERTGKLQRPQRGAPPVDRLAVLRAVLEAAGVEFIEQNGGGPGVRLRGMEG